MGTPQRLVWPRVAVVTVAVLLASGCAMMPWVDDDPEAQQDDQVTEMEVDPVLIRADDDGESIQISAEEAFEKAYYAFQARRYEEAAKYYGLIIEYFQDSRFYLPALYNGGLSFEELDQWEDAADAFRTIVDDFPDSEEALNAEFRLGSALHELGEYEEVGERLTELLLRDELEPFDRMEAHVRRGNALLELEEWSDAENSFRAVVEINEEKPEVDRLDDDHRFLVMSHFGRGQANHGRMNEIPLKLPPERMADDLEEMADYHLSAQAAYIQALRQYHPYWSVAAGYKAGRLYEDLYVTIFTAEIPDDLTEEELAYYFEALRDKLEVLMERAMSIYERNLALSRRISGGVDATDEWIDEMVVHKERLRAFLDDKLVQQRAEELVLEKGHLDDLWDAGYFARQHIDDAVDSAVDEIEDVIDDEELLDEVASH